MTRRLIALLCSVMFVAAACAAEPVSSVPISSTTTPPPAQTLSPSPSIADTLPPPTVLAAPVLPNPLTQQIIETDMLSLMPMPRLEAPLVGFIASVIREETNETAVDRLPASYDEADDQATFGRENGYRSVLRPTRFYGTGTLAADTWVSTFTTALGASEYLEDYAKDLAKNGDAGRAPDLVTIEVRTFPVEEVGDEAAGFIIVAEEPSTGAVYQETIVALRVGRLLAFTSLFRDDDLDARISALQVAAAFEARIVSILDGSFEVVEIAPDPELGAFTFAYRQSLTQRYRYVVVPEGVDDSGGGDGGGDEDGETPGTTIPVKWDTETDTTSVRSEGTVIGNDFECSVRVTSPATSIRRTYIVAGDLAWVSDRGGAFKEIDRFEEPWAADLVYCPGWSPDRTTSGVRTVTRPGNGVLEPFGDELAERFTLDRDDLIAVGLGGEDGTGISVSWFNIATAGEGPWVVDLALRMSGTTAALERAVGPGFYPGATVSIDIAFEADDLNADDLSITLP